MEGYVIDTYAWVELFRGSDLGKKFRDYIVQGEGNITHTIALAELRNTYMRQDNDLDKDSFHEDLGVVRLHSEIITELDETIAIWAGEIRATIGIRDISLVDCILIALARKYGLKVLSGDKHFRNMDDAIYIGGEENGI